MFQCIHCYQSHAKEMAESAHSTPHTKLKTIDFSVFGLCEYVLNLAGRYDAFNSFTYLIESNKSVGCCSELHSSFDQHEIQNLVEKSACSGSNRLRLHTFPSFDDGKKSSQITEKQKHEIKLIKSL